MADSNVEVAFKSTFRDSFTQDVPSSGANEPSKSALRALGGVIQQEIDLVANGVVIGAATAYAAKSALTADYATGAVGRFGVVYADGTASNNGVYIKGSSAWVLSDFTLSAAAVAQLSDHDSRIEAAETRLASLADGTATGRAMIAATDAAAARTAIGAAAASALTALAPLAAPTFTGSPAAPTPTSGDNTTALATTAFVTGAVASKADATATGLSIAGLSAALDTKAAASDLAAKANSSDVTTSLGNKANKTVGDAFLSGARSLPGLSKTVVSSAITGFASSRAALSQGTIIASDYFGQAIEITGAEVTATGNGFLDVALVVDIPFSDPNSRWLIGFGAQKTQDSTDPAGEGVDFRVQWLDKAGAAISQTRFGPSSSSAQDFVASGVTFPLTVAMGAVVKSLVVSRTASTDSTRPVDFVVPATTRFATVLVRLYHSTGKVAIGLLKAKEVTDSVTVVGDLSGVTAQVSTNTSAVAAASLTSADQASSRMVPAGSVGNGGALTTAGGRVTGLVAPSGQTAKNTLVTAFLPFTPDEIKKLVGKTLVFTTVADVTANFLTERPLNAAVPLQAKRSASTVNTGTVVSVSQSGTVLTSVVSYTVTSDDIAIGNCFQLDTPNSTSNAHTLTLRSAKWTVQQDASVATAADTTLSVRADRLKRFGFGPVYEHLIPLPLPAGGSGTSARTVNGRPGFGLTIAQGGNGGTSLAQFKFLIDPKIAAAIAGRTIRCVAGFNVNVENNRVITPFAQNGIAVSPGSRNPTTIIGRMFQSDTRRLIEFWWTLPTDEIVTDFRPFFQNGTVSSTAQDDWFELTDLTFDVVASTSDIGTLAEENQSIEHLRTTRRLSSGIGPILDDVSPKPQFFGGAVAYPSTGTILGWRIPSGQAGGSTLYQPVFALDAVDIADLVGCWVRQRLVFATNPEYARAINVTRQVILQSGSVRSNSGVICLNIFANATLTVEIAYQIVGDEAAIANYIANGTNATSAQDDWIKLTSARVEVICVPGDGSISPADMNARIAQRRAARKGAVIAAQGYAVTKTVNPGGGADYTTLAAAEAGISDATPAKRYEVRLSDGQHVGTVTTDLFPKSFVDIYGKGRGRTEITSALAADAALAQIRSLSTLRLTASFKLSGVSVYATNMRYAGHADDGNTASQNSHCVIENCHFQHFGNQAAIDYQTGLGVGGDPGGVWTATRPIAAGAASGQLFEIIDSVLISGRAGFYVHDNADFARPCKYVLRNTACLATDSDGVGIEVDSIGAGTANVLEVEGCEISGVIRFGSDGWGSADPNNQPANRANWTITGRGNTRVPYVYNGSASRALRIESATTGASSSVAVSGTFVAAVFGFKTYTEAGADGIAGAVYGWRDVSGALVGPNADQDINRIGYLLNDCRTTSIGLHIVIDGGSPIDVVFDQDYRTGISDTTILATINTALGSAATASLMDVTERSRPRLTDEEAYVKNTDTTTIRRKRAAAFNTDGAVRVMTHSDAATLFAGIALEDIRPGQWGRVKKGGARDPGVMRVSVDIDRTDSDAFVFGDGFGIDPAAAGRLKHGATPTILTAINAMDVRLSV